MELFDQKTRNMKHHLITCQIAILTALFMCACQRKQQDSPKSQLDEAAIEARALQILDDRKLQEEMAAVEALKIAEEREKLNMMAAEKRGEIAADLSNRSEIMESKRLANLELAASEMARREAAAAEVKEFVDSVDIHLSKIDDKITLRLNGELAKDGIRLISPAGYTVKYKGKDADYYMFSYDDDWFELTLKRTSKSVSFAKLTHKKQLAEGVPAGDAQSLSIPASGSPLVRSGGLTIMSATFGAENVRRDLKDMIRSKIQNGRLEFSAHSGELGGDPIFGKSKEFRIKYMYRGGIQERTFREGERVSLP